MTLWTAPLGVKCVALQNLRRSVIDQKHADLILNQVSMLVKQDIKPYETMITEETLHRIIGR